MKKYLNILVCFHLQRDIEKLIEKQLYNYSTEFNFLQTIGHKPTSML